MNQIKKTKQIIEIRTDLDNPKINPVLNRYISNFKFKLKEDLSENLYLYIFDNKKIK